MHTSTGLEIALRAKWGEEIILTFGEIFGLDNNLCVDNFLFYLTLCRGLA